MFARQTVIWLVIFLALPTCALASESADLDLLTGGTVRPQHVYSHLVAETLRGLLEEVLILGMFIVGVGHISHAARDPGYLKSRKLKKSLVLLAAVMLFVTYMKLTYYVEWTSASDAIIREAKEQFTNADRRIAALMVILLTPVDLCVVAFLAGMFLVLARDEFLFRKELGDNSLIGEVRLLHLFTGGAHFVTVVWWILFGTFTGGVPNRATDILYHAVFATLQLAGYAVIRRKQYDPKDLSPRIDRLETRYIAYYATITFAVYASRLWIYVFRYTS